MNGVGSILLSVRASSSWAGRGRVFQEEQELYKPKKDFANRMCAKPPTSAMPTPSFCVCLCQPSAVSFGGGWLCCGCGGGGPRLLLIEKIQ